MSRIILHLKCAVGLSLAMLSHSAFSQWFVDIEAGIFKPERNKVRIPNDNEGDRFNINDIGNDAVIAPRFTLGYLPSENHEIQLVLAPFSYTEKGKFDEAIRFNGETFLKDDAVKVRYQFSSYRLRYLYHLVDSSRWQTYLGATLFVRDASIKLSQNGTSTENDDLGVVPLFAFRTAYSLTNQWSLLLDSDAAFSPQGRALDLALLAQYNFDQHWKFSGGYRTIEGGADVDKIYNFAWFNGAIIKASYAW